DLIVARAAVIIERNHVSLRGYDATLKTRAAVDMEDRAVHVAVGHEEQDSTCGLIGVAPPVKRVVLGYPAHIGVALVAQRFADKRRIDRAGRKRVYPAR